MSDASKSAAGLRVEDFDFELPSELIAQEPLAERGQSRMLAVNRANGSLHDAMFADLPAFLRPGDLLVLNDSRVIPARLYARRTTVRERHAASGLIEVLLTEPCGDNVWRALVKPGKKVGVADRLEFQSLAGSAELIAEILERGEFGERVLRFEPVEDFFAVLERIGHMPLPPYIRRDDKIADRERYQTVFSRERGSVAAPTAGLHFTPHMLRMLRSQGVEVARVTLHVCLGTFAPLRVERLADVHLHRERYSIDAAAAGAINSAKKEGRRVVAVGTTVVRTLEAAVRRSYGAIEPHFAETDVFISPGFEFRVVDALLTNFHLPKSSLLMLVSAFAGRENVLAAYRHAIQGSYRFFSYGDCMFLS